MPSVALSRIKTYVLQAAILLACATPVRAQTYEPALIPAQINGSPTTMTPLNLGDDATRRVSLGFEFEYWDQTFTEAWVSSNGFVSFQSASHLCCDGQPIEQAQRNTIYAYWSDLVSFTGNPYYRRDDGSILFGWYGTSEYGANNSNTFEIGLFADGKIQLNYGNLGSSSFHTFAAGITGPSAGDNVTLFYGRDTQYLQNQSGILSRIASTPAVTIDCDVTPMDPSCPPISIDAIPDPTEAIAAAIEQSVELGAEQMDQVRETATAALERAEEVVAAVEVTEEPETSAEVTTKETATAERLEPDQVAALAAGGIDVGGSAQPQEDVTQDGSSSSAFAAQVRFDTTFGGIFGQGPTMSVAQSASPLDAAMSAGSPLSLANSVEVLGLGAPAPSPSSGDAPQSDSGVSEGESDTISEMGAVPGFAAYTQASLQDRADFYAIRDIYRRRVLRDANFELYRLMQTNDARWQEMVDEQYR
jgi:hypothetical protein